MATFVLDGGLDIVTNRIKGAGTEPLNVGWGTAAGTTARTDTTLFTEKLVDLTTSAGYRSHGRHVYPADDEHDQRHLPGGRHTNRHGRRHRDQCGPLRRCLGRQPLSQG
jgi:hypothetical protein